MAGLRIYRRHTPSCGSEDPTYTRCKCPCYVNGQLRHKVTGAIEIFDRQSLNIRVWVDAVDLVGEWTRNGTSQPLNTNTDRLVAEAVTAFLQNFSVTNHAPSSYRKYDLLLRQRLVPYCQRVNKQYLVDVEREPIHLTTFRGTWRMGPNAMLKTQELLRSFFKWCVNQGWLKANPALSMSRLKKEVKQAQPFTQAQMVEILDAITRYPKSNTFGIDNRAVLLAFVLLLRWTGLRSSDAVALEWKNLRDGTLDVVCQKNKARVVMKVNPAAMEALTAIRRPKSPYVFYKGAGKPRDAQGRTREGIATSWRKSLRRLFALTSIGPGDDDEQVMVESEQDQEERGHAHRFRHTFAVELLLKGWSTESVAKLLGDTLKTTEEHYSAWTKARQSQLDEELVKVWQNVSPAGVSLAPGQTPPADAS